MVSSSRRDFPSQHHRLAEFALLTGERRPRSGGRPAPRHRPLSTPPRVVEEDMGDGDEGDGGVWGRTPQQENRVRPNLAPKANP